ncbi:MAG: hypothetical protein FWD23_19140 [Oscillospiraceae bacterium]|nr:hypothetical protein [Oscillospiraceae bacterium]
MGKNIRIYDRFEYWSVADCACEYCVNFVKNRPCLPEMCCIADIREEAIRREQGSVNGSQAREEAKPCPE